MDHYLQSSLHHADRDTQVLFHWPGLWTDFHLDTQWCMHMFEGATVESVMSGECNSFRINDWKVEWTGWKQIVNSNYLVCQWIGYGPNPFCWHTMASYPGSSGVFKAGMIFDTSLKPEQRMPVTCMDYQDQNLIRLECLRNLCKVIRQVGFPPYEREREY